MQKGHFGRKAALFLAAITASAAFGFTASADFSKSAAYPDNLFTDLEKGSWYETSVKDVYEFGLMKGDSETTFSPNGTLTAAEGVTVAVRIHQILHGTAPVSYTHLIKHFSFVGKLDFELCRMNVHID